MNGRSGGWKTVANFNGALLNTATGNQRWQATLA